MEHHRVPRVIELSEGELLRKQVRCLVIRCLSFAAGFCCYIDVSDLDVHGHVLVWRLLRSGRRNHDFGKPDLLGA